ncbi:P-loop NTPase fold protein [Lentimicrobium sp. S6]|uniref:P-loop NTPase fold protein n=1 Tax=Lentimicrobium sp. S6 TaxID=2735872 RepID=UPI001551BCC2|nr:P-loop NTPase fold protein [Lentimicrobium sp. S6]NPD46879.1 hypothetical protein [Lentimicrobium sp. S6]
MSQPIQEFFKEKDEYEVFHLFPVNYSIANNEDIMQYIKVEILFQLFGRNVDFDKIEPDKFKSIALFAKNNILDILLPFTRLIPLIGKTVHSISDDVVKIIKKFRGYHKEHTVDDKEIATEFLSRYYSKEGSIYEDDFITQLIRQLLKQIESQHSKHGIRKETVLVVDDLDRMDPEHIFRILNVFGAHFDSEYKDEEGSNKFGFSKIIIVCDIENIKSIYHHKYGAETKFDGYIDKFFSEEIFQYKNHHAVKFLINNINKDYNSTFLNQFIWDMIRTNNLSLRELLRLNKLEAKYLDFGQDRLEYRYFEHIIVFSFLCRIMSWGDLNSKINDCLAKLKDDNSRNYNRLTINACITLGHQDRLYEQIIEHEEKKYQISYAISDHPSYFDVTNAYVLEDNEEKIPVNPDNIEFSSDNFYSILIEVLEKFKGQF